MLGGTGWWVWACRQSSDAGMGAQWCSALVCRWVVWVGVRPAVCQCRCCSGNGQDVGVGGSMGVLRSKLRCAHPDPLAIMHGGGSSRCKGLA